MIGEPSTKRRLQFGEMVINRVKKEMMVTRKNTVPEIVEFDNGFNGLARSFALMKVVVSAMTLIVAKMPYGFNGVEDTWKNREKTRFVNHSREEDVNKVLIL